MLIKTELIVLDAVRYSDTALIVHTYSREVGPLHVKVTRSGRHKSSTSRIFLTPLSLLETSMDFRHNREVQIPLETHLLYCPSCISTDPVANAVTHFLTELLFRLLRNEEPDYELFGLLRDEIFSMDSLSTSELANFHIVLLLRLMPLLGIQPRTDSYRPGYILDIEEGVFCPPLNDRRRAESPIFQSLIELLGTTSPHSYPLSGERRNALLRMLLRYYSHHFPSLSDLRSLDVLSALF